MRYRCTRCRGSFESREVEPSCPDCLRSSNVVLEGLPDRCALCGVGGAKPKPFFISFARARSDSTGAQVSWLHVRSGCCPSCARRLTAMDRLRHAGYAALAAPVAAALATGVIAPDHVFGLEDLWIAAALCALAAGLLGIFRRRERALLGQLDETGALELPEGLESGAGKRYAYRRLRRRIAGKVAWMDHAELEALARQSAAARR
jgi:hypothetical protein